MGASEIPAFSPRFIMYSLVRILPSLSSAKIISLASEVCDSLWSGYIGSLENVIWPSSIFIPIGSGLFTSAFLRCPTTT